MFGHYLFCIFVRTTIENAKSFGKKRAHSTLADNASVNDNHSLDVGRHGSLVYWTLDLQVVAALIYFMFTRLQRGDVPSLTSDRVSLVRVGLPKRHVDLLLCLRCLASNLHVNTKEVDYSYDNSALTTNASVWQHYVTHDAA